MALATRDKLLVTATRLFYERGISASGVDAIAAESRVSKPTLCAHFRAKGELVAAVLERQHLERQASLEAYLREVSGLPARERLLSVFDWIRDQQRGEWARGCPFVNASWNWFGRPAGRPATSSAVTRRGFGGC